MSVSPLDAPKSEHEQAALPAPDAQKALPAPHDGGSQKNSGGIWRRVVLVLILLACCAFGYWRIRGNKADAAKEEQKTAAAANRATPVTVAPVAAKTMPIYFTALGTVTAYNSVTIKSRVDGQLLSVNVREGQQVKQGQVLAMIDPRPYAAAVAQAEGQLAKDEAAARNNEAEANRYRALYEAGVVSKETEQAQISNSGQSVGTLDADRAAIQAAKVNVAYTRITSPINGVVGLRQVDPGNIVHAADSTGLILVTQLQPISVIFTLPEDQLPEVLKLMRAGKKLVVDAYDRNQATHLATGTLLTVDNQIDTTTGTVKGKAVFDNKDGALFPNQFVNARLVLEERENSLVIPAAALQTGASGNFVYVVKEGTPPQQADDRKKKSDGDGAAAPEEEAAPASGKPAGPKYYVQVQNVVVDLTEGSQIILKSGVNAGDSVVIDGQEKLKPFGKVAPKQGQSNAGSSAGKRMGSAGAARSKAGADATPNPAPQPSAAPAGQAGSRP